MNSIRSLSALALIFVTAAGCSSSLGPECAALAKCCASLSSTPSTQGASCNGSPPTEETACEEALMLFQDTGSCTSIQVQTASGSSSTTVYNFGDSGGPSTQGSSSSAASSSGTSTATSDAASPCNMLTNTGTTATPTPVVGATPTGMGGTVIDGTYVLSSVTTYWPAANPPSSEGSFADTIAAESETISVSGATWQVVENARIDPTTTATFTYTTSGPTCMLTCGSGDQIETGKAAPSVDSVSFTASLSASGSMLVVYHTAIATISTPGGTFAVGAALTFTSQM